MSFRPYRINNRNQERRSRYRHKLGDHQRQAPLELLCPFTVLLASPVFSVLRLLLISQSLLPPFIVQFLCIETESNRFAFGDTRRRVEDPSGCFWVLLDQVNFDQLKLIERVSNFETHYFFLSWKVSRFSIWELQSKFELCSLVILFLK